MACQINLAALLYQGLSLQFKPASCPHIYGPFPQRCLRGHEHTILLT